MSWALAALAALFFYQLYRERVRALIEPQILADAVLIAVVFVVVLIVVSLITVRLSDRVLDSRVGAVDRTLGFIFGLVRGLILVVIAYELIAAIVPKESLPRWVTEARSLPVIERTGRAIISLLPDNPASIFRGSGGGERSGSLSPHERRAVLRVRNDVLSPSPAGEVRRDLFNS
jgi:membrane protein required for colicin V production